MSVKCLRIVLVAGCLHLWIAPHLRADLNEKNDASVKAAFRETAAAASQATVRVLAGGRPVALAAVVDANGYLVTKASVLKGKLTCRLRGGRELEATIVGTDNAHDLALLKIDAGKLTPVRWRSGGVPRPGSLVAATGPDGVPLAVGVVSTEPRKIGGSTRPESQRGWLGIGLGGGQSGLGITSVASRSAAEKAGVKQGDLVKSIDGKAVKSVRQVVETVGSRPPGKTIKLVVQRGEEELDLTATLGRPRTGRSPRDAWGGGPFSRRRWGFPVAVPHDTAVHPDDCGGPLVDTDGNVVGINIARALRVTTYAIPARTVKEVVEEITKRNDEARMTNDE